MEPSKTVRVRSYRFAVEIVKLCLQLKKYAHYEIAAQLLRSGTSIGANIEEASASNSRKDFFYKMSIASKEAMETHYWLRLLRDSGILTPDQTKPFLKEMDELTKMLTSIVKTGNSVNSKLKTQNSELP